MLKHLLAIAVAVIIGMIFYVTGSKPLHALGFIAVWAISGAVAEMVLIPCSLTFCSGHNKLYSL